MNHTHVACTRAQVYHGAILIAMLWYAMMTVSYFASGGGRARRIPKGCGLWTVGFHLPAGCFYFVLCPD